MPTTKPARKRATTETRLPRTAPTYPRLPPEKYAALDEREKRLHDALLDVCAIFAAVEYAELDRRAFGFPSSVALTDSPRYNDPAELNAVEAASQRSEPAVEWLAEYTEILAGITRIARLARVNYGFDPERGRDETNRPQQRSNQVPLCVWCGDPAPSGRSESGQPLRRDVPLPSGGKAPIHAATCYHKAKRDAMLDGRTIQAVLAEKQATTAPTRPLSGSAA